MGHTHYFAHKPLPPRKWKTLFMPGVRRIFDVAKESGIALANGAGDPNTEPVLTENVLHFNGSGELESYESLYIARTKTESDWCKVGGLEPPLRKPYDAAVVAVLILADHVFGKNFSWHSDGDCYPETLTPGKQLFGLAFETNEESLDAIQAYLSKQPAQS